MPDPRTLSADAEQSPDIAGAEASHESGPLAHALVGSMLGTAVGDALGLACEGLSPRRQAKIYPSLERYGFLFGIGMISDDTEHTVMVAQALIVSGGDETRFARDFAWRLKGWLLALPAGIGMATGRAIIKLLLFIPPKWSGVKSAGNGPAMRAAVLGVAWGDDPAKLASLNGISTRITHRDERVGREGIPAHLLTTPVDWPRSPGMIERVARRLAHARLAGARMNQVRSFVFAAPLRNLFFLLVVLAHGFRRLLPPY